MILAGSGIDSKFSVSAASVNLLNTELNSIRHLLALLGAHRIIHVSRIRIKIQNVQKLFFLGGCEVHEICTQWEGLFLLQVLTDFVRGRLHDMFVSEFNL
jgi:hypothetical protein